jgi:hypothetical protein
MMIRCLTLALAAIALGTFTAETAAAQDSTSTKDSVPSKDTVAVSAGVAKPTIETVIGAVNGTPATLEELKMRPAILSTQVMLVNAGDLVQGQDESSLNTAVTNHRADLEAIRRVLDGHAEVRSMLARQAAGAEIIAAEIKPSGNIVLYYRVPASRER